MGKTKSLLLTLCLGAWVGSAEATEASVDLGVEFKQIFHNTTLDKFEHELITRIRSENDEVVALLADQDREGVELTRKIYAGANGALLEQDHELGLRRTETMQKLSEALRDTLADLARYYFREDVHGAPAAAVAYRNATFEADAQIGLWLNSPSSWYTGGGEKIHTVNLRVAMTAADISMCIEAGVLQPHCRAYNYESDEMISYEIDPHGHRQIIPENPEYALPEAVAKAHPENSFGSF